MSDIQINHVAMRPIDASKTSYEIVIVLSAGLMALTMDEQGNSFFGRARAEHIATGISQLLEWPLIREEDGK